MTDRARQAPARGADTGTAGDAARIDDAESDAVRRAAEVRSRFDRPELAPLWRALRDRVERATRPVSRVRVGPLSHRERAALADLLGLDRLPGETATVSVSRLDRMLDESLPGMDSRAAVEAIGGPIVDRVAQRRDLQEARRELWAWLETHPVVTAEPALQVWVGYVRGQGLVARSVDATRDLLEQALAVLDALPGDGGSLPAFAARVCGDPHALDDGTRLATYTQRALACIHGSQPPASAAERRALWQGAGLECDALSTSVLVAGVRAAGDGPLAATTRAWTDAGHACRLTLAQLRARPLTGLKSESAESLSDAAHPPHIRVVENPSILAAALDRFGAGCPPLVCTAGWPNTAVIELLRQLTACGARLSCHADLDGEGLRIAAYVVAKLGAAPWRMTTGDYLRAAPGAGPGTGRVSGVPWDPALAETLGACGVAVTEETVVDVLLDDLAR